jgi:hypothetical protein
MNDKINNLENKTVKKLLIGKQKYDRDWKYWVSVSISLQLIIYFIDEKEMLSINLCERCFHETFWHILAVYVDLPSAIRQPTTDDLQKSMRV